MSLSIFVELFPSFFKLFGLYRVVLVDTEEGLIGNSRFTHAEQFFYLEDSGASAVAEKLCRLDRFLVPLAELDQGQCDQSLVLLLVVSAVGALEVVLGDQVKDAPIEGVDLEAVGLGTVGNPSAVGLVEAIEVGQGSGD